jgi:fused signal recognition particle receptor
MGSLGIIVVVIAVIAALVYFFVIKKKEPEALPVKAEAPSKPAQDSKKEPAKVDAKPEGKKDGPKADAPKAAAIAVEDAPPPKKFVPPAEPLSSSNLESEPAQPALSSRSSKKDIAGLRKGLTASRTGFIAKLTALFSGKKEIDPQILEQMEEVMLTSDVGVKTTQAILERLRESLKKNELADEAAVRAALKREALRILTIDVPRTSAQKPAVILMVGVNGVGKTTTIGKLATRFTADGKKVMLAAGDTFRAAAVQQLEVWGKRVGAEVVKGKEGADPGAVAYEATTKAREAGADTLFVDTAGRLHTKVPLMDEIKKVKKTITKAFESAPHETLLVLDATTGQNALNQAQMFKEAIDLTGIVLTKLDGTAKGGIVLAIADELKVPVRYIGLGERAEDLREFSAEDFVEALFGGDDDEQQAA